MMLHHVPRVDAMCMYRETQCTTSTGSIYNSTDYQEICICFDSCVRSFDQCVRCASVANIYNLTIVRADADVRRVTFQYSV